jgi:hypothetical protein
MSNQITKEARLTALVLEGRDGCALMRAAQAANAPATMTSLVEFAGTLGFSEGEAWGVMFGWDNQERLAGETILKVYGQRIGFVHGEVLGRRLYKLVHP